MTQDVPPGTTGQPTRPGGRARRVPTSRAERRSLLSRGSRGGRRKAPQPGRTVAKVITSTLLALALATGVGVVLVYNNWNGNLDRANIAAQLKDRPTKEVEGPREPMNILVMGSDSRSGKGNNIDGESGGGLSDTTILFHLSADRKFAYGISIPRDTAVQRPTCYRADGSEIAGSGESYEKWNAAFAVGGPACTVQQFEQLSGVLVDKYIVVDFNGFKDMVNALDGVEVCIPQDINDEKRKIYLKAGTREVKGNEALTYIRVRYKVGDGTDTQRTRRQQAFIGSMVNKALTAGMLTRPDRLVSFMNAFSSSLKTDFKNIAEMADLAVTARGVGAENIKFVTTPWGGTDKVSGGVEWTPDVEKLWRLVIKDKPLTEEFRKDALSAADRPDGSKPPTTDTASPSDGPSESPSEEPSPSDTASPTGEPGQGGLDATGRAAAGLCT